MEGKNLELKQALEGAIYREIGASKFYGTIAKRIENPEGSAKFRQLSKDEVGHRIKLESLFKDMFDEAFSPTSEGIEESEIEEWDLSDRTGALEALDIAIEAEASAEEFYTGQAESTDDERLKKLFTDLAEEEKGHHSLLEAEKNSIIGGFYWFDMDSTSFMED